MFEQSDHGDRIHIIVSDKAKVVRTLPAPGKAGGRVERVLAALELG